MEIINTQKKLPRMRTLDEAYTELKTLDPDTAVSKYFIRQLALRGAIPTVMCGRKRLINFDGLLEYLDNSGYTSNKQPLPINGIRAVKG